MLQQTTVAAVARRFDAFVCEFPNVGALAAADEQQVLRAWEGLGYYRRARDLHAAARHLVDHHQGAIPNEPAKFAELPGIGRYMLGAVLSQAFDRKLPIVEANTKRLLCRLFGHEGDLDSAATQRWLWETAEAILPVRRVGDFNQALMELGAIICTVRNPNCRICPLRNQCKAFQAGKQEVIPARRSRPQPVPVRELCIVFRRRGRVLLMRRPGTGRGANMWEFPRVVLKKGESLPAAKRRLTSDLGLTAKVGQTLATISYSVTRFRMTMTCIEASTSDTQFNSDYYEEGRWLRTNELADYPVSSSQRKLARILAGHQAAITE